MFIVGCFDAVVGNAVVGDAEVGDAVVGDAVVGDAVVGDAAFGDAVGDATFVVVGDSVVDAFDVTTVVAILVEIVTPNVVNGPPIVDPAPVVVPVIKLNEID